VWDLGFQGFGVQDLGFRVYRILEC
jgi:hypothetical protein